MCRWNAYVGEPLLIDDLLFKPKHGLIDESLHARMGAETTNEDGFGLGWYLKDTPTDPARYRSVNPAWNDANLRDLARHVESHLFLAHIRAAIGSPVQQSNCHPFRHHRWLFVHNGLISGFPEMRREILMAIDPELFRGVTGSTDSETLFYLALSYGLEDEPLGRWSKPSDLSNRLPSRMGSSPVQMTIGIADGEHLWAIRYSSNAESRTLFISEDVEAVQRLHPDPGCASSPRATEWWSPSRWPTCPALGSVPESTGIRIEAGSVDRRPFEPRRPESVS